MHPLLLDNDMMIVSREELYDALEKMADETFSERCSGDRNDFANWVEHELGDKFLAASMRRAKTKEEMRKTLFVAMFR